MGGRGRPRRARRAQTDCRQASGGLYRCCMCFLVGGGWRAWRNVHRRRDPGRAVPGGASRGAWADAGGGGASLPPTRDCMGGSCEPACASAAAPAAPPPVPQRVFLPRSRVSGKGCRAALLLSGTGQVLQRRVLSRTCLRRRVLCAVSGSWGGTCALQRAEHAVESQLLSAKHHG